MKKIEVLLSKGLIQAKEKLYNKAIRNSESVSIFLKYQHQQQRQKECLT